MLISEIDEPWSFENIRDSYFSDFTKTKEAIDSTEGGRLWKRLDEVDQCRNIFTSCANDVLESISVFAHATTKDGFWSNINRPEMERLSFSIRKNVFSTSSSAMALVDHARRFEKNYPITGASEKRQQIFLPIGIHEFVQGLRNYIVHVKISETNWEINHDFILDKTEVNFFFGVQDLNRYDRWNQGAKEYINAHGDRINVYGVISSYLECVTNYYKWHSSTVIREYSSMLEVYFGYKKIQDQVRDNTSWNMIISHLTAEVDLFQHLPKYLTPQQTEHLLSYPLKSREQIDRLIEIIDLNKACDDELREKIYATLL